MQLLLLELRCRYRNAPERAVNGPSVQRVRGFPLDSLGGDTVRARFHAINGVDCIRQVASAFCVSAAIRYFGHGDRNRERLDR